MKEELEDKETFQPRSFFFNFIDWTPYVDVSSESIADLCKSDKPVCDDVDTKAKMYLSTILCRVPPRKPRSISIVFRGTDHLRVLTYQGHDGEKIVPLIGRNISALRFYMRLYKDIEECSRSYPVSCSGELSRQEAQKNEDVGERDDCCTASNDAATLVRVKVKPGFTNRSHISGHYCIRIERGLSSG